MGDTTTDEPRSLDNLRAAPRASASAPRGRGAAGPGAEPPEMRMPEIMGGFGSLQAWEFIQRVARGLCESTMVPTSYRRWIAKGKGDAVTYDENFSALPNCIVALEMANRLRISPLMVMQNLYIVEGKPTWSGQFVISLINSCGRYSPIRYRMIDEGEIEVPLEKVVWKDGNNGRRIPETVHSTVKIHNVRCVAYATEKASGDVIEGPEVSMAMAVAEGWYDKNGSKWKTMPDMMLRYRAGAFFGRTNCPDVTLGLPTAEEARETLDATQDEYGSYAVQPGPVDDNLDGATTVVDVKAEPEATTGDTPPATAAITHEQPVTLDTLGQDQAPKPQEAEVVRQEEKPATRTAPRRGAAAKEQEPPRDELPLSSAGPERFDQGEEDVGFSSGE